jgi:hypothetical protein
LFAIILALLGSIRIQALFAELTEGILIQNEVMEMAGAGTSDAQDDFRNAKYDLVKKHSEENLKKYLFGKRESVSGIEGKMLLSEYLNKINEDILLLKPKKDISYNGYLKNIYKLQSANKERIYYYAFNNIYHNSYICSHLPANKEEIKVYSSMEECALSGAFPCKKCVLGYEK